MVDARIANLATMLARSPMVEWASVQLLVTHEPRLYDTDTIMRIVFVTISVAGILLAGCSEPPPPVSTAEFMENPRLLEATMVRCGQNRAEMKYEPECVNARDAVNRLERVEARERQRQLEAQSERKRQALRRTQEAAAAARRRAEEERRRREEAEYLGIFEDGSAVSPPVDREPTPVNSGNAPGADFQPAPPADTSVEVPIEAPPPDDSAPASDLEAVREELRRRQQTSDPR